LRWIETPNKMKSMLHIAFSKEVAKSIFKLIHMEAQIENMLDSQVKKFNLMENLQRNLFLY